MELSYIFYQILKIGIYKIWKLLQIFLEIKQWLHMDEILFKVIVPNIYEGNQRVYNYHRFNLFWLIDSAKSCKNILKFYTSLNFSFH